MIDYHLKYSTGNVFRFKEDNHLYIIVNVTSKGVDWIPFNHSGVSGFFPFITDFKIEDCTNCNEYGLEIDCDFCNGNGKLKKERRGMDQTIIVSSCVGDFIYERINQIFYKFNDE